MQQPRWKKWLSYFRDLSLEVTSSHYNPHLEVLLVKGRHQLVTRDAIYSFDDKYFNFDYAFSQLSWEKLGGNRVLLLGLGLGSVIILLEKKYDKVMDYTAVEIDPEICRLCSIYTLDEIEAFVEVIPTDALGFVEGDKELYDLVIMDVFESGDIPMDFQSDSFLSNLKQLMKPKAVMLYNRMNIIEKDKLENASFRRKMATIFPDMTALPVRDNIVFVSDKQYLKSSED